MMESIINDNLPGAMLMRNLAQFTDKDCNCDLCDLLRLWEASQAVADARAIKTGIERQSSEEERRINESDD